VVLVHGTTTWSTACFEAQRTLARHYRLLVMDRRGFGESPAIDRSDYEADARDGAHLVGHSYGGVLIMLAAGLRPQVVCTDFSDGSGRQQRLSSVDVMPAGTLI